MRYLPLVIVLPLVCCGPDTSCDYPKTCDVPGYGTAYLEVEDIDCAEVAKNVLLSRRLLVDAEVATEREHMDMTKGTTLVVRDPVWWFSQQWGYNVVGTYRLNEGIKVGRWMDGLLHEEIHAIQAGRLEILTGEHVGWEPAGYYALADFYAWEAIKLRPSDRRCDPYRFPPAMEATLRRRGWDLDTWMQAQAEWIAVAPECKE